MDAAGNEPPPAQMPAPLVNLSPRFRPFAMKDLMYIQAVQKYNSRGGKSGRVLVLRPQFLMLASEKPVVVTRTIRFTKISELIIERTGPGGQLGIVVKDDFGVKLSFPKEAPTLDDFLRILEILMRVHGNPIPRKTEVPEQGKTLKQDGLHARMTKQHIKKPPQFVPPIKEAVERKKARESQPRVPPPPAEAPPVEMHGMPTAPTPVAESPPESPTASPPSSPPPQARPMQLPLEPVEPEPESSPPSQMSKPRTASQPQLLPGGRGSLVQSQGAPSGSPGMFGPQPTAGGSDGYEPAYRRGVPPPLQVVDSAPYYVDPSRPVKNRVDFNQCEGVVSDGPGYCESPHSHYSIGSPTELNMHRHAGPKDDWLMRSMADALELEITELEERNQAMRLELMKEKELRHKNELQLHEKVSTLCKRVEQQQKIIDMYEQRDVLKGKLGASPSPARITSPSSGSSYNGQTSVEQAVRGQMVHQQQVAPHYPPILDSNTPVFSTSTSALATHPGSPPRYCPPPTDYPSHYTTTTVKSTRLLNLI